MRRHNSAMVMRRNIEQEVPTMVSLFSGTGGLDLGLEQAGFCTLLANEVEPYACESLRMNRVLRSLRQSDFSSWFEKFVLSQRCYKSIDALEISNLNRRLIAAVQSGENYLEHADIVERDIRKLSSEEVLERIDMKPGQLDLIAGGPPCQPFSRAGKRELVDCDTGQLFMEFVRMVEGVRPRWFIFENVKGLVIHKADVARLQCAKCTTISISDFKYRITLKNSDEFTHICHECKSNGRHFVTWENRRSGSLEIIENEFKKLGYTCTSQVLNAADYGAPQLRERLFIVGSRDGERINWPSQTHYDLFDRDFRTQSLFDKTSSIKARETINSTLYRKGHWRYGTLDPRLAVLWVKNVVRPHDEPVTWTLDRPAPTIGAHQSAKLAIAPYGVPEDQLVRQQWHVLGRRQGDTAPVFVEHEYLTDEELLTLQTFPVSWYLHGTRMERAFQIGNAVPPILAKAVGGEIMRIIRSDEPSIHERENVNGTKHTSCV